MSSKKTVHELLVKPIQLQVDKIILPSCPLGQRTHCRTEKHIKLIKLYCLYSWYYPIFTLGEVYKKAQRAENWRKRGSSS